MERMLFIAGAACVVETLAILLIIAGTPALPAILFCALVGGFLGWNIKKA